MIDDEDSKFLQSVAEKANSVIEKECKRFSLDRAFFKFTLSVEILGQDFLKMNEKILFEDDPTFCIFCGTKTNFYDKEFQDYLCPSCFAKSKNKPSN